MVISKKPIKIEFPSILQLTDPFVRFTEELCIYLRFERRVIDNIVLAVDEALVNAIRHGNHNNPELTTTIEFFPAKEGLTITITDHGDGFDLNKIGNPLDEENLLRRGGRGVFLIQKLVEKANFIFTNPGTKVIMFVSYEFNPQK